MQEGGVAVQVFRRAEVQGADGRRGVVDGAEQGHRGAAPLEPVEGTAIEGRGNSFRLIVKVSIGGRHFHGAVTP